MPDSRIARDAIDLIRSVESDLLYHHALRVYSGGALQAALRGLRYDPRTALHRRDVPRHRGSSRGIAASTTVLTSTAPTLRVTSCASTAVSGDALRTVWDAIALP